MKFSKRVCLNWNRNPCLTISDQVHVDNAVISIWKQVTRMLKFSLRALNSCVQKIDFITQVFCFGE